MKITDDILKSKGIDPSLFTDKEKEKIGCAASSISSLGQEECLLRVLAPLNDRVPDETDIRNSASDAREEMNLYLKNMIKELEKIALCCSSRNSIFSTGISKQETDAILCEASQKLKKIYSCIEKAIDSVSKMYASVKKLSEIQITYNSALYELGIINIAFRLNYNDTSNEIFEAINTAFERLNGITSFINDLKDRAIIGETALERKIPKNMENISEQLDLNNDGASLNTSKTLDAIFLAKQTIINVLER